MHKETKKDENKTEREKKGKERAFFFSASLWQKSLGAQPPDGDGNREICWLSSKTHKQSIFYYANDI